MAFVMAACLLPGVFAAAGFAQTPPIGSVDEAGSGSALTAPSVASGNRSISAAQSIMKTGAVRTTAPITTAPTELAGATVNPPAVPSAGLSGLTASSAAPMKLATPQFSGVITSVPGAQTLPKGAAKVVKAEIKTFTFHSAVEKAQYERAANLFPSFCREWERMLHEREVDNLGHISWQARGGYETATYTGYGRVESCETKESIEGVPIGKITYEELSYYLAGKTVEEARRSAPKLIHQIHTLEIFSWDKDKWFY